MEQKSPRELEKIVASCFQEPHFASAYVVYDDNYVVAGSDNPPDYHYIYSHCIQMFNIKTAGGTIVVSRGDIGVGIFADIDTTNSFLNDMKNRFLQYLQDKGIEVAEDNNDILIEGFKVSSYSSKAINGSNYVFGVFQFSVNVNLDLINHICKKPMNKIPKGLSEYGITTEEILENIVLYNL